MTAQEIRLASRPKGWPTAETFEPAPVDLPPLADGQVLVRNLFMSVDPYMRGRMNDVKSYVPPFQVGQALEGGAIGEVVESRARRVEHRRRRAVDARLARCTSSPLAKEVRTVDRRAAVSAHLGVLGMPGLTAWVGLKLVDVKAGDRVFVSGRRRRRRQHRRASSPSCAAALSSAARAPTTKVRTAHVGARLRRRVQLQGRRLRSSSPPPRPRASTSTSTTSAAIISRRHWRRCAITAASPPCGSISRYNDETPSARAPATCSSSSRAA